MTSNNNVNPSSRSTNGFIDNFFTRVQQGLVLDDPTIENQLQLQLALEQRLNRFQDLMMGLALRQVSLWQFLADNLKATNKKMFGIDFNNLHQYNQDNLSETYVNYKQQIINYIFLNKERYGDDALVNESLSVDQVLRLWEQNRRLLTVDSFEGLENSSVASDTGYYQDDLFAPLENRLTLMENEIMNAPLPQYYDSDNSSSSTIDEHDQSSSDTTLSQTSTYRNDMHRQEDWYNDFLNGANT